MPEAIFLVMDGSLADLHIGKAYCPGDERKLASNSDQPSISSLADIASAAPSHPRGTGLGIPPTVGNRLHRKEAFRNRAPVNVDSGLNLI